LREFWPSSGFQRSMRNAVIRAAPAGFGRVLLSV
jgi:hypothetical protein